MRDPLPLLAGCTQALPHYISLTAERKNLGAPGSIQQVINPSWLASHRKTLNPPSCSRIALDERVLL